jgi:transposase
LRFFMTAGQVSDDPGAAALLGSLPAAEWLIAVRGYDADWFRDALKDKGIRPCIPGRKSRAETVLYDRRRYRRRNRIEIMFGRLKDWRRVATRYDRCAALLRKGRVRDSSGESSVVDGLHEQTHPAELQDEELAGLQRSAEAARFPYDLVRPGHGLGAAADGEARQATTV